MLVLTIIVTSIFTLILALTLSPRPHPCLDPRPTQLHPQPTPSCTHPTNTEQLYVEERMGANQAARHVPKYATALMQRYESEMEVLRSPCPCPCPYPYPYPYLYS